MLTAETVVLNPTGLHARPAAFFVSLAGRWTSKVQVENVSRGIGPVDAKSILRVLTLGAAKGHTLRLSADGPDEEAALAALLESLRTGLGEQLEPGAAPG